MLPVPDDKTRDTILSEQGTDGERLRQDTDKLIEWLEKQPHLPQNLGKGLLECFSVGCKGVEDAKTRLDRYFSVRNHLREFYAERDPGTSASEPRDPVQQFLLPGFTDDGRLIYIIRVPNGSQADKFDAQATMKRQIILTDYILYKGTLSSGLVLVYDLEGVTSAFLHNFSISLFARCNKAFQDNYPLQVKKLIFVNCSSFVVTTFENLIKPLIKKKFTSRVVILKCGDQGKLKEMLPDRLLPAELGGDGDSCQSLNDFYLKLMVEERSWCLETESQVSQEHKRLTSPKYDFKHLNFGLDGNFRQLALD